MYRATQVLPKKHKFVKPYSPTTWTAIKTVKKEWYTHQNEKERVVNKDEDVSEQEKSDVG